MLDFRLISTTSTYADTTPAGTTSAGRIGAAAAPAAGYYAARQRRPRSRGTLQEIAFTVL